MPKNLGKNSNGVTPNGGANCRWSRLNAGTVAANWRPSTRSVVNLVRSQVYDTERSYYLFASKFAVVQRVLWVCQRQVILVFPVTTIYRGYIMSERVCVAPNKGTLRNLSRNLPISAFAHRYGKWNSIFLVLVLLNVRPFTG